MAKALSAGGEMSKPLVPVRKPYKTGPGNHVPDRMWEEALRLLRERRVMQVESFDDFLSVLAVEVDPTDTTAAGRNRRKNLVDHVKAQLTKGKFTRYATIGRQKYVMFWPWSGQVHGVVVMDRDEADHTLDAFVRAVLSNGR